MRDRTALRREAAYYGWVFDDSIMAYRKGTARITHHGLEDLLETTGWGGVDYEMFHSGEWSTEPGRVISYNPDTRVTTQSVPYVNPSARRLEAASRIDLDRRLHAAAMTQLTRNPFNPTLQSRTAPVTVASLERMYLDGTLSIEAFEEALVTAVDLNAPVVPPPEGGGHGKEAVGWIVFTALAVAAGFVWLWAPFLIAAGAAVWFGGPLVDFARSAGH